MENFQSYSLYNLTPNQIFYLLIFNSEFINFFRATLIMNSENCPKQVQSKKENGICGLTLQSKDKNTTAKEIADEVPVHYVVVQTKRKKEVILISSSESQVQGKSKESQAPLKQTQLIQKADKTKKIKKTVFKCQLCKASGKKSQMKACINCRHYFHSACIENEVDIPKRYMCQKCRFQKEQQLHQHQRKLALEQRQMSIQLQKFVPKKSQKQKKKQESTKRHNQFSSRYPFYVQDDQKLKYPIQDKLLIIYKQIFEINENSKPKPKTHPLIPSHLIEDFLQIQNFFSTFKDELQPVIGDFPKDITKNYLYFAMNNDLIDEMYSSMVYCLIKIYLSDIFDKNKTDNVKMLNENCFFTLLTNMHQNQDLDKNIIVLSAQQIIRHLSTIPSMRKSFEDFVFPSNYDIQSKIYILVGLIKGLSEIDTFHEFVAAKSQKMQNLTKQKGQLVNQLKIDQAQNLSNKEKIKQFVNFDLQFDEQLNKNDENASIAGTRQITKQKDKNKRKIQKLANQKDKSQRNIQEIRSKISEINKNLPFATSQVVFLGKDRNESQYFFFCNESNRIYCKYRNFLLDDSNDFFIYEGKQTISELHKSLNPKGIHQKHLSDMINAFVKEQIIVQKTGEQQSDDYTTLEPCIQGVYNEIKRDDVIQVLRQFQETFSNYLAIKNLQWTAPAQRDEFLTRLKNEESLHQIRQMVITLQESFLFVEPVADQLVIKKVTVIDSDQQDRTEKKQSRKKSPVRLWGINSQRIKRYWVQYLQQCVDFKGVWVCTNILKNYVNRYVKKKMEFLLQQQKKQDKTDKQKQKHRLRKQKEERQSQKHSRQRSRQQRAPRGRRPNKTIQSSQQLLPSNRPNLRERKKKKFQIDSDVQAQQDQYQDEQVDDYDHEQQSESQEKCEICGQYGEMICCDTCPKVFHLQCLKIKEIPQGQWVCFKCLEKMANRRQTRSRACTVHKPDRD